jgi:hypothetical protein
MSDASVRESGSPGKRIGPRQYAGVIVVEVVVVFAIWLFQRYFGS